MVSVGSLPWRRASCLLLVLATGCDGCKEADAPPALLEADDATPVDVWVGEGLGTSPVDVPLYATNALGAAVPGGALSVTSDGDVAASVTPDAGGWAVAAVSASGPGRYTVSAEGVDGAASVVDGAPGRIDARAVPIAAVAPNLLAGAGAGEAWSIAGDVWWSGFDGAPAARVLALPESVTGLVPADVDGDGVGDLVVVSPGHLVLLRGRAEGGLVWGAGWAPTDDLAFVAAAIADIDGDEKPDLNLAIDHGGATWIYQLGGDGGWGFTAVDALDLDYAVVGLSAEDLDADGIGEVSLLTTDGLVRRYTKVDGVWDATHHSEYDLHLGDGGLLLPSTDLTGDGVAELVAAGPGADGTGWRAWIVTAGESTPQQYPMVTADAAAPWLGLALGDLTGDGLADLAITTPDTLTWAAWSGTTFTVGTRDDVPGQPLVDLFDADGDGVLDVALGGPTLRVLPGIRPDDGGWDIAAADAALFGLDLAVEPVVADVNGDAIVDIVGLVPATGGAGVALQGLLGVPASGDTAESLVSGGTVPLAADGAALDVAVCGTRAYALYSGTDAEGTSGTWLARADLDAALGATLDGDPVAVTGAWLACGTFAAGEVVVADVSGAVTYVDAAGAVTAGESLGVIGGLAAADVDGDGLDDLLTCADDGCFVGAADLDGDGTVDVAQQDAAGILVTLDGDAYPLVAPGTLRLDDADGDGLADLVLADSGAVWVVRAVPGGLTPAVASWTWRPVAGAVHQGDLDGDGLPDAFFLGDPADPTWAGAIVYARAE